MFSDKKFKLSLLSTLVATCLIAYSAHAQEQEEDSSTGSSGGLEVIEVTAERRVENLQTVPVSVSAFSESSIERRQIDSTLDVVRSVPNLVGSENVGISSATSLFMRGVGQDESLSTQDPAVGTYIDGIYVSRQVANNSLLYDIERIEVLRGPQGILYGRNTSGGAVKIITKDPSEFFEGSFEATVGNYDTFGVNAKVNVPLSDEVFISLAGFTLDRDKGFQKNVTTGERMWDQQSGGVRGALKYDPSSNFELVISAEYAKQSDAGIVGTNFFGNFANDLFTVESGLEDSFNDIEQTAITANMTWTFDSMEITSITGYRDLNQRLNVDFSDNPVPAFVIGQTGDFKQFSQEIQASGDIGDFSWVLGAFYMDEDNDNIRRDELFLFGGVVAADLVADFTNTSESIAIFGQGSYSITDKLIATFGGRWTRDDRAIDVVQSVDIGGGVLFPIFDNATLEEVGTDTDPTFTEFTPHVGLEYEINKDLFAYVSYSEGFKAGGWNARATAAADYNLIEPEFVDAYEFGVKAEFLDNTVRLNTAVFYNDYTDFVVTATNPETNSFVTINAASTQISGVEMELTASPNDYLDIYASVGYLSNDYDDLGENVVFDINNEVKRTPEYTAQIGFNFYVPLNSGDLTISADYSYQDEYYGGPDNTIPELSEATNLLFANVSYAFNDGDYVVGLSCSNCTDEEYHHSTLDFSDLGFTTLFPGAPRTIRLTGKILF